MNAFGKCTLRIFRSSNYSFFKTMTQTTRLWKHFYSTALKNSLPCTYSVETLGELFDIPISTAFNIMLDHKKFAEVAFKDVVEAFKTCIDAGIERETLLKHVEILTMTEVSEKIELLRRLPHNLNTTAPLLMLDKKMLNTFIIQEMSETRITFFSKLFDIKLNETYELLSKRQFLITLDLDHIKQVCNLLQKYRITKEEICKDLWVLKYSIKNIETKLEFADKNNIDDIKTWMVRVPMHTFENTIRRKSDNQLILGDNSFVEYLSKKLQCSQELAKYMISKHPAIQHKYLRKTNEMIDFLLANGFKTQHICKSPKILLHSVDTIRERLKSIEEKNTQLNSLSVCTKSKKQFEQFLESITSEKNEKNKRM